MSSVTALTLRADRKTTGRRSSPVPQLSCKGRLCQEFQPDVVQCRAVGSDWSGTQWSCTADLPARIKLGAVEVSCEGWASAEDSDILAGSCALEYRLVPSSAAYDANNFNARVGSSHPPFDHFMSLAVCMALGWAIYRAARTFGPRVAAWWGSLPRSRGPPLVGGGGGGGGPGLGGGSSNGGAPPPYKAYANPHEPEAQSGASTGGFPWRSIATGAAAGLAAQQVASHLTGGRRNLEQQHEYDWQRYRRSRAGGRTSEVENDAYDWGVGGSGTRFGATGGGGGRGEMRGSTGFGGTRNR